MTLNEIVSQLADCIIDRDLTLIALYSHAVEANGKKGERGIVAKVATACVARKVESITHGGWVIRINRALDEAGISRARNSSHKPEAKHAWSPAKFVRNLDEVKMAKLLVYLTRKLNA